MNKWQATFLGLNTYAARLSGFEIEAFFTFAASERALIEARRGPSLKLGLALQIGFLRMSGRGVGCGALVPPALWKHSVASSASRPRIWRRCGRCIAAPNLVRSSRNWPARRCAFIPD